ncbi:MAG: NADH-quinone oxidoreductase subunit M [Burkholderiaceae bacterium]
MLTAIILLPIVGALALALARPPANVARLCATAMAAVSFVLLIIVWIARDAGAGFSFVQSVVWLQPLDIAWRVGVDGLSLPIMLMSAIVFVAAIAWPMPALERPAAYYAWLSFLLGCSLGVFAALDLVLFYVFFDLSLVGMYFLIGRWGHGDAQRSALTFFIYTLVGSLALLLGLIMLAISTPEVSFDLRTVIAARPLADAGLAADLTLLALIFGLAVKTPLFPVHGWLPPAHVDAPGPASTILAGVLLKMGTYGMARLAMQAMPETFARWAAALAVLAVISLLWGAMVSFAQQNLKRRIAYTSINHMGYVVLGIAVAGAALGNEATRSAALSGAIIEMVAHGLITGTLFLLAGALWQRTADYSLPNHGGLAQVAPRFAGITALAAFASLGLPGLAGFVAELQIFVGAFAAWPWLAAVALTGILITAAQFLILLRSLLFGPPARAGRVVEDLRGIEWIVVIVLMGLVVLIGVWPGWLIAMIGPGSLLVPLASHGA